VLAVNPIRLLFSVALLAVFIAPAQAQKEDWQPITQHDLEIKQVPGNPGADAVQLYYANFIDDQDKTAEFFYHRIKILNDKGKGHADVEVIILPGESFYGLKARTIQPDGRIVEFTGKPYEKTVIKARGISVLAKAFTMPEVNVGSIIEYKYKVEWPGIRTDNSWTIQHELYTVKESFRLQPHSGGLYGFEYGFQVATIYSHMPNDIKPVQKSGGYELDVENMPAFESEGYMPPEEDLKPQVRFFYVTPGISTEKFWLNAGRRWNDEAEHFIGNRKEISQAAAEAIGNETDPEQKLRRLYARAQQVRNLTYERERTEVELKKENIKLDQNAGDVLARGVGDREDITRLFVGLARAAGFEASIVRMSDRKNKFFDKGLLSREQLETEIALVHLAGKDIYLDPGTRFCPYGYLRWIRTSTQGIKLDKKGGVFVMAPAAPYDKATTRRNAEVALDGDGNLTGMITVKFEGGDALEHRLDELQADEAGKKKDLEDELQRWLPHGAVTKLTKSEGWETSEGPLTAIFTVSMPGYASVAGKRLLVPAYFFQARQMDAFKHVDRKYPVYFPYAFGEVDKVSITLPAGYTLENTPQQQTARLPYAAYQNVSQFDGKQLVTQRILQVNGIFFKLEQYPEVKTFFGKVQAGDEQQAVLTSVTNAGAVVPSHPN
jgi:transglutaminase superfamily protein